MLTTNVVLLTSFAYIALLFLLAFLSEAWARRGRQALLRSPVMYTLSLSVYCTSWTFYGAVGSAARNGLEFATIYLGPTLVFIGWWYVLRKLVRIGRVHRITSIADSISSRYGKSTPLGMLVTVMAVTAATPYIALQLEAVATSFEVVANTGNVTTPGVPGTVGEASTAFWVAVAMAVFTILFGTRNIDADEHHPGVVAAIAFEALVKLLALLAVGLFVVFGIGDGVADVFERDSTAALLAASDTFGPRWVVLTLLSATAIVCLPRQFQVTVVENADEEHLRTASWLFPLYLLLISLFVVPIAIMGLAELPPGSNPDMFVLTLPMSAGQDALALFAFIGGFSSATSMVIVASIALSIMMSNHIVVPLALRLPWLSLAASGDVKKLLLVSRRISIAVILALGFLYVRLSAQFDTLASIGLIAFAGVAQFLPCVLAGLYWRNATARGAAAGLAAGFVTWAYTLLMPSFEVSGGALSALLASGPWDVGLLRPQALFGLEGFDPLVHALFWSVTMNVCLLVGVSLATQAKPIEQLQSALFVDVFRGMTGAESRVILRSASVDDLYILAQRILGRDEAYRIFHDFARRQGIPEDLPHPDAEFIAHLERRLAGTIGAATARVMVSQVATGETISLEEVIRLIDETQQVIEYSEQLERKSEELETTAYQLREANERLKALDAQKDDFLSQVSHEVRTPMTSIRSFTEILLQNEDIDGAQTSRFLRIIHLESLRLTRLLDEILELSHLERGALEIPRTCTDAMVALDRAMETCGGLAEAAGVELRWRAPEASAAVAADPDRLSQVFINLVSNAIKYNTSPRPWVGVEAAVGGGRLDVLVRDNGPGIIAADRERIFDKFSRGWSHSATRAIGTGLGLAISRQIIRRVDGELELVETAEPGACFRVSIPLAPAVTLPDAAPGLVPVRSP